MLLKKHESIRRNGRIAPLFSASALERNSELHAPAALLPENVLPLPTEYDNIFTSPNSHSRFSVEGNEKWNITAIC